MICLDTTFLIDLWRHREDPSHATSKLLKKHSNEVFAVPALAAGEFLEGAAHVSKQRLREAVSFLRFFQTGNIDLETASRYAQIVADLRRLKRLEGASKVDLWISAWALQHQARLATENRRHFRHVPGLKLLSYGSV